MSLLPTLLGGGVIDSDCRDNICVILMSFADHNIDIEKGDRIAQISFHKHEEVNFELVEEFDDRTLRSSGGFGSFNR